MLITHQPIGVIIIYSAEPDISEAGVRRVEYESGGARERTVGERALGVDERVLVGQSMD